MTNQLRTLASLVALGFFASASGAALAAYPDTVYDIAEKHNAAAFQAGPAGPSSLPGTAQTASDWGSTETQYSVYHLARNATAPAGQAGRTGPDAADGFARQSGSVETRFSIYDLANRR